MKHSSRTSSISTSMCSDNFAKVPGLSENLIKQLAKGRVWEKAKRYAIRKSEIVGTKVNLKKNTIRGEIRRAFIYDQEISWGREDKPEDFNLQTILVSCDCKNFVQENSLLVTPGAPLGFSIDGFKNIVLLQKKAMKTAEILKILNFF